MAMAAIQSAYSYYLSTYSKQGATRLDTHKKSELRSIYNNILKVNKESPLYKIKDGKEVQTFAIDIKENARHIQNVISTLSGSEDILKAFQKKSAATSNKDVIEANYIGNTKEAELTKDFEVEVKQLAKPQINIGNFLKSKSLALSPETYSFDLETTVNAYEFQFNVNPDDTNYSIQKKLANLISNADVGLTANVIEDGQGYSALKVVSAATGLLENENHLFKISAAGSANSAHAMKTLGIGYISQEAQNSIFLLDGKERKSYSNTFTINNAFELNITGLSEPGNPVTVGFKADVDAIAENVQVLVDSYNSILNTATKYSESQQQSERLLHDMGRSALEYENELQAIGLMVNKDGYINVDSKLLAETIESDNPRKQFEVLNDFKDLLGAKASYAVLNPMEYVDKVMITYKNPGKTYISPYITSIYSGMMMDRYC